MTSVLTVRGLKAFYGAKPVLHGIDLDVNAGSVTTLLGANGAGKTSTLRAISGMLTRSGQIDFLGESILRRQTEDIVAMGIAHVPEGRGTFHRLTVLENLKLGAMSRKMGPDIQQDIEKMLELFPILRERSGQQAGLLSGGQQQMLAIARALMLRPKLLLLDEPSFGLAPLIVEEIFQVFRGLTATKEVSILLVEQNADLAIDLSDTVYLVETGRVVYTGTPESIRSSERIRSAYLGGST